MARGSQRGGRAFEMTGFDKLEAILARLASPEIVTNVDRLILEEAEGFAAHLRRVAPYDPARAGSSRLYGHLRENITVVEYPRNLDRPYGAEVTVGKAFWGYYLEYGTVRMNPHPWFRPAWEEWWPQAQRRLARDGVRALQDAMKG